MSPKGWIAVIQERIQTEPASGRWSLSEGSEVQKSKASLRSGVKTSSKRTGYIYLDLQEMELEK
jgi:hypothetical protein